MNLKCALGWLVLAVLGLGCTRVPIEPAPTGPSTRPTAAPAEEPASPVTTPAPSPRRSEHTQLEGSPTRPRFELRLPRDETFLHQPLPFRNPTRYAKWTEQAKVQVGHGYLYGAHFLANEQRVVIASGEEQAFRVYDTKTRRQVAAHNIPGSEDFSAVAVPWPTDDASVTVASTHGVFRISTSNGSTLFEVTAEPAHQLRWSPDERILVALDSKVPQQTSTLRFFLRVDDGAVPLGSLSFDERVDGFALSPDNQFLAVSQYPSDTLKVINLRSGETLITTRTPQYVGSVDFSPDGRSLAFGGEALVVLDLLNPRRRAYYGHFYNNLNTVRFSPSGDAIVASSYDGRIRVFALGERTEPSQDGSTDWPLRLVKQLRHEGHANVYGFDFRHDGTGLVSASGDRTVRWFGGSNPAEQGEPSYFQPLELALAAATDLARSWSGDQDPGEPFRLDSISAVRPTRMPLGRYDCKITSLYRLRECTVTRNAVGQTVLSFGDGNLLPLDAIVYDDGRVTRFIGALRETSSLYSCNGCDRQPILGVLRGSNGRYSGLLLLKRYFDPFRTPEAPSPNESAEEAQDRFPLTLQYRGPLSQNDTPQITRP